MNYIRFYTLLYLFISLPFISFAKFSAGGSAVSYEMGRNPFISGIDTFVVFQEIASANNPTISYTHDGIDQYTYTWYKIDLAGNETEVLEDQNALSTTLQLADAGNGEATYRIQIKNLLVDAAVHCAIINYANYPIIINELIIHDNGETPNAMYDKCLNTYLEADFNQNEISVFEPGSGIQPFTQFRKTYEWTWSDGALTPDYKGSNNPALVGVVFEDVDYTCKINDNFFTADPNIMEGPQASKQYEAIAVTLKGIKYTVIERPGDNEYIKSELNEAGQLTGSAPLDVNFEADEPSKPDLYHQWKIWYATDTARASISNDPTTRYSFTTPLPDSESNAADYTVNLVVSSEVCDSSSTLEIKLRNSWLEAPNLFVIGFGAGGNLDYRADYSSIRPDTFHGYIYNRWGRKVYEWSDLTKGWDGRRGGSGGYVSPGAYIVVLRGKGTDGKEYKIRHSLTILREK